MTSSQQQRLEQNRFTTVAKTVHAAFAKAGSDPMPHCGALLAAASDECFERGSKQGVFKGEKQQ